MALDGFVYIILLIPVIIIFLVVLGIALIYFFMGVTQIVTVVSEKNRIKLNGGVLSVFLSGLGIATSLWLFLKFLWIGFD